MWDQTIRKQIKACTLFIPVMCAIRMSAEKGNSGSSGSWR
jgi:hypothetical protein